MKERARARVCSVPFAAPNGLELVKMPGNPRAPDWFKKAIATPGRPGQVTVRDVAVRYWVWGSLGATGLVLVHGGGAHAGWWDHVAPILATERPVISLDLSGHGSSGRRETYDLETWSDEVMAVARAGDIGGNPIIVGHSMGGFVGFVTAARHRSAISGAVVVDSMIRDVDVVDSSQRVGQAIASIRTYASRESAMSRFHTVPRQARILPYVRAHIGERSLRRVDEGWQWNFDPNVFGWTFDLSAAVEQINGRLALMRAERGLLSQQKSYELAGRLTGKTTILEITDCEHHIMLDRPLALISSLKSLLTLWGNISDER